MFNLLKKIYESWSRRRTKKAIDNFVRWVAANQTLKAQEGVVTSWHIDRLAWEILLKYDPQIKELQQAARSIAIGTLLEGGFVVQHGKMDVYISADSYMAKTTVSKDAPKKPAVVTPLKK